MPDERYNLGIEINIEGNVKKELKQIENVFAKVSKTLDRLNDKTQKEFVQAEQSIEKYERAIMSLSSKVELLEKKNKDLNKTVDLQAKRIDTLKRKYKGLKDGQHGATKANENWLSSYTKTVKIALRSTVLWGLATTAIYGTKRAVEELTVTLKEIDAEMVSLQKVMNPLITDFQEMKNIASNLGVEYARSMTDVLKASVEWGRQGREQIEVLKLTEASLLASNVAEIETAESVKYLTSAILQFKLNAEDSVSIIDKWNEVSNNFATQATDLAESIKETGASAYNAGISMNELIGYTTALTASTAKSGNRIGNTLKTVFSRMRGSGQEGQEALSQVESQLNNINIALRTSEDTFRDTSDVLHDLAMQWENLSNVQQSNIAFALGGRRRYSDVISLMENWDIAIQATTTSISSMNSAIEENDTYMDSIQAKFQQVKSSLDKLASSIGDMGFEDFLKNMADSVIKVIDYIEDVVRGFSVLGEFLSGINDKMMIIKPTFKQFYLILSSLAMILNPVVGGIMLLGGAVIEVAHYFGEKEEAMSKAKEMQEQFNKAIERTNELTLTEAENLKATVDEYISMIDIVKKGLGQKTAGNTVKSWFADTFVGKMFKVNDPYDGWEEQLKKLRVDFPDLSKTYSSDYAFLLAVEQQLKQVNKSLDKNIDLKNKQINTAKTALSSEQESLDMLRRQKETYDKLLKNDPAKAKKFKEQMEQMYPDLMIADNFYSALQEKLKDYETDVDTRTANIKAMIEKHLSLLDESSIPQLDAQMRKNANAYLVAKEALDEMKQSGKYNNEELKKQEDVVAKAEQKMNESIDTLNNAKDSAKELNDVLSELNGNLKDGDNGKYWSQIGSLKTNIQDLIQQYGDFNTKIKEVDVNLQRSKDIYKAFGYEGVDLFQAYISETEKAMTDYKKLYLDIQNLGSIEELVSATTSSSWYEGLSELDRIDVDKQIEEIISTNDIDKGIEQLSQMILNRLPKLKKNIEGYNLEIDVARVFNFANENLNELSTISVNILKQQLTAVEEALEQITPENENYFALTLIRNSLENEIANDGLVKGLKEVDSQLSKMAGQKFYEMPIFTGDRSIDKGKYVDNIKANMNSITSVDVTDETIFGSIDSLEKYKQELNMIKPMMEYFVKAIPDLSLEDIGGEEFLAKVAKQLELTEEQMKKLEDKARKLDLTELINSKYAETLTPIQELGNQLIEAKKLLAEAKAEGLETTIVNNAKKYVEYVTQQYNKEFVKSTFTAGLEEAYGEAISSFNISDYDTFNKAIEGINKYSNLLQETNKDERKIATNFFHNRNVEQYKLAKQSLEEYRKELGGVVDTLIKSIDNTEILESATRKIADIKLDETIGQMEISLLGLEGEEKLQKELQILQSAKNSYLQVWRDMQKGIKTATNPEKLMKQIDFSKLTNEQEIAIKEAIGSIDSTNIGMQDLADEIYRILTGSLNKKISAKEFEVSFAEIMKIDDKDLNEMGLSSLESAIEQIDNLLVNAIGKDKKELEDLRNTLVKETSKIGLLDGLKEVDSTLANIAGRDFWNNPILTADRNANKGILSSSIGKSLNAIFNKDLTTSSIDGIQDYKAELQTIIPILEYLFDKYDKLSLAKLGFDNWEQLKVAIKGATNTADEFIKKQQAVSTLNTIDEMYADTLTEVEKLNLEKQEYLRLEQQLNSNLQNNLITFSEYNDRMGKLWSLLDKNNKKMSELTETDLDEFFDNLRSEVDELRTEFEKLKDKQSGYHNDISYLKTLLDEGKVSQGEYNKALAMLNLLLADTEKKMANIKANEFFEQFKQGLSIDIDKLNPDDYSISGAVPVLENVRNTIGDINEEIIKAGNNIRNGINVDKNIAISKLLIQLKKDWTSFAKELENNPLQKIYGTIDQYYQNTLTDIEKAEAEVDMLNGLMDELTSALAWGDIELNDELIEYLNKLSKGINYAEENLQNLKDAPVNEFLENLRSEFEQTLSPLDRLNKRLETYVGWEEEIIDLMAKGKATQTDLDMLYELIKNVKEDIYAEEHKTYMKQFEEDIKDVQKLLDEFDINEVVGITGIREFINGTLKNAIFEMGKIKEEYLGQKFDAVANGDWDKFNHYKQLQKEASVKIAKLQEVLNLLTEKSIDIQYTWSSAVTNGILNGIGELTENERLLNGLEKIGIVFKNVLSEIFSDENLTNDLKVNLTNMLGFESDGMGINALMGGLESFSQGRSIGGSVLDGMGSALIATGNPLGMLFGAIGSLGEALWGGDEGADPQHLNNLKQQVADAKNYLSQFNLEDFIPNLKWEDKASWWDDLWGGTDIKIFNEKEIKEALEEIVPRVKQTWSDLAGGFSNALKSATSFAEFEMHFKSSIGQALQNSIIDAIIKSSTIEGMMRKLTEKITRTTADGIISQEELTQIKEVYESAKYGAEEAFAQLQQILDDEFFNLDQDVDNSQNQTFTAGSTTSITYNNQYVVQSTAFMGNEEEAIEFAQLITPYIEEEMARY